jgi:hypothetical protein
MYFINGKATHCPECSHHLAPNLNYTTEQVEAYCPICDKLYCWTVDLNKDKEV